MMVRWCLILFSIVGTASAQGKLVLVGGGSEDENGWSNEPYAWIVDHASNKKVVVISYTDEDNWIPDYFKSLGAVTADNIKLDSRAKSDLQATYDLLMQYDAFFFKGGDQSFYYNYFNGTKTEQAIIDKFNAGGVMSGTSAGMAILSGVIYAALNNSVYPDMVLENFLDSDVTLRDDFLPFLSGIIVDTHLTERGRGARLMGFMANWYHATGELITGVGVDDRTALCIDENKIGHVYGTGTVSIYNAGNFGIANDNNMVSDSIHVTQLLYGNRIDLETLEILESPGQTVIPEKTAETGNYEVILSGSEGLSSNLSLLAYFVEEAGEPDDSVLVVTNPGNGQSMIDKLKTLGVDPIVLEISEAANASSRTLLRNNIRKSKKVLFVENDDEALFDFLNDGPTGQLLYNHIRRNGIVTAFIGEDSRYAGKTFVTNHLTDELAAYYGELEYRPGLELLTTSTVVSNTYDEFTTDFYENTTAAIPFAMISEKLKYGIYLNRNSYVRFYQQGELNIFKSEGALTTIIAINSGTKAEPAFRPVNQSGDHRNYAGFSEMRYVLLNGAEQLFVGIAQPSADEPYVPELITATPQPEVLSLKVFPNPSRNGIFQVSITHMSIPCTMTVSDPVGKILQSNVATESEVIDLSSCAPGMYYLTIVSGQKKYTLKLVR